MLRVTWFLQKEKESGHKQRGKESTQLGESKQSKQRYQQGGLHWTHEHYTCSIIIIIIIIIIITIGRFVVGELSIPQIQKKMSSAADHSLFFFLFVLFSDSSLLLSKFIHRMYTCTACWITDPIYYTEECATFRTGRNWWAGGLNQR